MKSQDARRAVELLDELAERRQQIRLVETAAHATIELYDEEGNSLGEIIDLVVDSAADMRDGIAARLAERVAEIERELANLGIVIDDSEGHGT